MKKLILAAFIAMTAGAAMAENEQIVFSTPNLAMPFEVHMQRTAVKAAKEMGVSLQVLDGQGSSPKQVADLENAITRGAQGFIVSPNDVNAVSSAVDEIQDANLPVVTLIAPSIARSRFRILARTTTRAARPLATLSKANFLTARTLCC